ncbi:protein of unknown function [Shinella sp. WSC3-e]|nr:protein of unknown function [Shinella sp. WSC3-e]
MNPFLPEFSRLKTRDHTIACEESDIQLTGPQGGDVLYPSSIPDLYGHLWV